LAQLQKQAAQVSAAAEEREAINQKLARGQNGVAQLTADLAAVAAQEAAYHEAKAQLQALAGERKLWQQELSQLQTQARQVEKLQQEQKTVLQTQQSVTQALQALAGQVTAVQAQQLRLGTVKSERDVLEKQQPTLKEAMDKLKARIDQLAAQEGGDCPLCGQPLSREHQQKVVADLTADGKQMADEYRANRQKLADWADELVGLETAVKELPHLERNQQKQTTQLAQAEARLAEIDRAVAEGSAGAARLAELEKLLADKTAMDEQQAKVAGLETAVANKTDLEKQRQQAQRDVAAATARLAEIERLVGEWESKGEKVLEEVGRRLEIGEWEMEARQVLAGLEGQVIAVGYEAAAHEAARVRRDELAAAPQRQQELGQAQAAVRPLEEAIADGAKQVTEQTQTVADLVAQKETAVAQLETLTAESSDRRTLEDEVNDLRQTKSEADRRVGSALSRLAVLDDLRERREGYVAEQNETKLLIQRLRLLEKACGRDGVQALLIEQAVPDIEDRANELLERLTGGEMQVRFQTQKQLKSRDAVAETLDIQISDRSGERPYENFSGGEQFRVNFAIRLALSQILAKRAGARLQTLVIDEGFGSQDPNGRQRLVEAIHTIQDDFARILVITHIDELRDAFPTRIEVEKRPSGSAITVI
jgi:exonuclease SbcC